MPSFLGGHQECHYRGSGISATDPWTAFVAVGLDDLTGWFSIQLYDLGFVISIYKISFICIDMNFCKYEYRTKVGMSQVLRGSWGCHCCKTDRGPP